MSMVDQALLLKGCALLLSLALSLARVAGITLRTMIFSCARVGPFRCAELPPSPSRALALAVVLSLLFSRGRSRARVLSPCSWVGS